MPSAEAAGGRGAGRLQMAIATGLGLGYAPLAPGTVGSIPGLALAAGLDALGGWPAVVLAVVAVSAVGGWAASGAARRLGARDPGPVVIDEVAGQMLALLAVPIRPATLAWGFVLFRLFDVLKPFPVRRLEALPGGSGIMADDLAAAVYANLVLQVALRWFPA